MKAILVIDMPSNCAECSLRYWGIAGWSCICTRRLLEGSITEREEWCPLRPLPQRKETNGYEPFEIFIHREGWNQCLDEITGDKE